MIEVKAFELYLVAGSILMVGVLVLISYFDIKKSLAAQGEKEGYPQLQRPIERKGAEPTAPITFAEHPQSLQLLEEQEIEQSQP